MVKIAIIKQGGGPTKTTGQNMLFIKPYNNLTFSMCVQLFEVFFNALTIIFMHEIETDTDKGRKNINKHNLKTKKKVNFILRLSY